MTGWCLLGVGAILVFGTACDHASSATPPGIGDTGPARPGSPNGQDEVDQVRRTSALKSAVDAFRGAPDDESRRSTYRALLAAVADAKESAATPEYSRYRNESAEQLLGDLSRLQEEANTAEAALAEVPVKPEYELPKYTGAFYLEGTVKKCYDDGVAIQSGSKYYFLRDGKCPEIANVLRGYVEATFNTVELDLGRSGRSATVVDIRDKETADDDRARYRTEIAEYQKEYKRSLEEFKSASKGKGELLSQLQRRSKLNEAARGAATAKLDRLLLALATGQPLDAVSVDELPTQPSSDEGESATAPGKDLTATAKNQGIKKRSQPAKRSPMACMKACIAGCGGDSDCERRCVAQDCR